ncbi:MAG: 3-methyl-2-oxobutanoate dehydrogenase subunit VorB [Planctomycetota bacterium]|jgi:2-oxoisovalerate ferredoxin oxidoreductase alpha subunit|nr:3-methyl-2-oxobutanoate dehydrogenase subunit VorB [Planctomycetota bacterium]
MATQLMKGNHAVVAGALYAGCDCYFGYPITPASEILQEASEKFPELGRRFVQAESEEAAANMLFGAAAAGHRAMTASSGPGISLKQEAISYLAGAELPAVIVDIMRSGPGLGNIGPEQSDYNQMVKGGGHGNYRCLVLAPGDVQEMCDLTGRAFDLADKYRNPVVVLADGVLGQMVEPLKFPERAIRPKIDASWAVSGAPETAGNVITSIHLDFDLMEKVNLRLQDKYAAMAAEADWEEYRLDDAAVVVVAYGITSRIARTCVDAARDDGVKAGLFRPRTLFPFPSAPLAKLAAAPGKPAFLAAEMSNGQLIDDVRLAVQCSRPVLLANRMGGNVITEEGILAKIREAAALAGR